MSNTQRSRLSSARSQRDGSGASRAGSARPVSAYSRAGSARSLRSDVPEPQPTPLLRPVTANNPRSERAFYSDILGPASPEVLEELTQGPAINVASRQAVRTGSNSISVDTMTVPEGPENADAGGSHKPGPRPPPKSVCFTTPPLPLAAYWFFFKKNPSYVNTNCHVRLCLCVLVRVVRATDGMGREPIYLSIYIYICIYESRLMSLYLTNYLPHLTCIFYFAAIAKEGA